MLAYQTDSPHFDSGLFVSDHFTTLMHPDFSISAINFVFTVQQLVIQLGMIGS